MKKVEQDSKDKLLKIEQDHQENLNNLKVEMERQV
jgi:hypothetical protein